MKFLSLPVMYTNKNYSEEMTKDLVDMGVEEEDIGIIDYLFVNIEHITAYNKTANNKHITMRLSNGECWLIVATLQEFEQMLISKTDLRLEI